MYNIIVTVVALLFFAALVFLLYRENYMNKILSRLGLQKREEKINWAAKGWENCLEKLNLKAEIVFFGDSLTRGSDFSKKFTKSIVNLGLAGDTIEGMINRVSMIKAVAPNKVFLMGGINSLNNINISACTKNYNDLVLKITNELPDAELIIQSVLPIASYSLKAKNCHNQTVEKFNANLKCIAKKYNLKYVDLYSAFEKNGEINGELTKDGLHLNEKAYDVWAEKIGPYIL